MKLNRIRGFHVEEFGKSPCLNNNFDISKNYLHANVSRSCTSAAEESRVM